MDVVGLKSLMLRKIETGYRNEIIYKARLREISWQNSTKSNNYHFCSNKKCYMRVHRSGELYKECPIVIYEYQKGRDYHIPLEFYRAYKGVIVTDG